MAPRKCIGRGWVLPCQPVLGRPGATVRLTEITRNVWKRSVRPWPSSKRTTRSSHRSNKMSPPRSDTSTARASPGSIRLYTARQVAEQRGTIPTDYTVAREAADGFYQRLRELFARRRASRPSAPTRRDRPVTMKRMGIEGIYLGGWATSAKGSTTEDPGPDLASYPLSQVPDEAAVLVRALLTADRNQQYLRLKMSEQQRATTPGHRLPAVHHRRRRHRPRRRPARAQPGPPLRRGRRAGIPHRRPAPGHQEVRPPGRQGAGAVGRTDQAPQRRPLPARRHAGAGHHRRPHRRRSGQPDRQSRRRARPAVPARRDQPERSFLQGLLPGAHAALPRAGCQGTQRAPALCAARRGVRRRRRVAGAPRHLRSGHRRRQRLAGRQRSAVGRRPVRPGRVAVRRRVGGRRRA